MAAEGTEPPTARRLREARERGFVPRSAVLAPGVVLTAVVAWWAVAGSAGWGALERWLAAALARAGERSASVAVLGAAAALEAAFGWLLMPLVGVLVLAWLSDVMQSGWVWASSAQREPTPALLRGFLSGTLLWLTLLVALGWASPAALGLSWIDPSLQAASPAPALSRFALAFALGLALVVSVDVARARAAYFRALRMTRREQLRERRETEGPLEPKRRRMSVWRAWLRGSR